MSCSQELIREKLKKLSDEKYKKFSSSLLPETKNILGVRLPLLRKLAGEIYKTSAADYILFKPEYFEEIMLQGMIIGLVKDNVENIFKLISDFVPKIDNWSVCDSFCCGLKFIKGNEDKCLKFLIPYLKSEKEFDVRFGLVILLNYYINDKFIDSVLEILNDFRHEGYYAKMAAAWAVSICYLKFPQKTADFLKNTRISRWTYNKAIQKIIDSNKLNPAEKQKVRKLKRF